MPATEKLYIETPCDALGLFYSFLNKRVKTRVYNSQKAGCKVIEMTVKNRSDFSTIIENFKDYVTPILQNVVLVTEASIRFSRIEKLRREALAKLSEEEIRILGIGEDDDDDDEEEEDVVSPSRRR